MTIVAQQDIVIHASVVVVIVGQNNHVSIVTGGHTTSTVNRYQRKKKMKMRIEGYNPQFDFKADLSYGHEGEQNLIDFFHAFNNGAVEVKADRYRNGRMAVETEQRPKGGDWKPSGINVTKAQWWAYRFAPDSYVLISVARLKNFLRTNYSWLEKRDFASGSDNPARGFLLQPSHVLELQTNEDYD